MRILGLPREPLAMAALSATYLLADAARALACGCLSPPIPEPDADFAVNQQAEQIVFEVEQGFVTAHVLIKYAGDPEQFGWLVPVPAVPEPSTTRWRWRARSRAHAGATAGWCRPPAGART